MLLDIYYKSCIL